MKPLTQIAIQATLAFLIFGSLWWAGVYSGRACFLMGLGALLVAAALSIWQEFK